MCHRYRLASRLGLRPIIEGINEQESLASYQTAVTASTRSPATQTKQSGGSVATYNSESSAAAGTADESVLNYDNLLTMVQVKLVCKAFI